MSQIPPYSKVYTTHIGNTPLSIDLLSVFETLTCMSIRELLATEHIINSTK
ncbi:hypothetical protein SBF1_5170003 [Candidatus Desulfosporosinus infrequens]|uniref:Uncharacterized protein n=1 Tax=Candidatus Desulfosporosinus infrequens TaxID=2043169 RepID=A0A2U3LI16_9FIRM|nr:hypothetical protein SBF1_5170003 [Candidatus Desulfosporosinus infrequens]